MPTEQSRIFRENLKLPENADKLNSYRLKQREHNRKFKEKQHQNETTALGYKQNVRDRKRKSREKLKENIENSPITSLYSSSSSRSKAVAKCIKSLPSHIGKKQEVLSICSKRFKVDQSTTETQNMQRNRNGFKGIESAVVDFFSIDMISKQLPGMKDFVTITNASGDKVQIQKRVLQMSLLDAHNEFIKSFPNMKISFSKFCKLRPKNVSLFSSEVHYSCLCIHCENLKLLLDGLFSFMSEPKMTLDMLMRKITCHSQNFECVAGICEECNDSETILKNLLRSCCFDEITKYKEWRKQEGYMQKVFVDKVSVQDVFNKILSSIKDFKIHRYLKSVQQNFFKDSKDTQNADTVTLVVDFAENFATKAQYEVQSSYFGRKQISLFTAVAWIGQSNVQSFVIASDNTRHSKEQVAVYMRRIFLKLKRDYPQLLNAKVFSDGAGSQFKNHFIMSNLLFGTDDYDLNLEWHFFATCHGKSSADGLGGTIKRGVYYRMLTDQWDIYSAKDFVNCSLSFVQNTDVFEVTQTEVKDEIVIFEERWKRSKVMQGMQSRHCFKPSSKKNHILMAKSSLGDHLSELKIF